MVYDINIMGYREEKDPNCSFCGLSSEYMEYFKEFGYVCEKCIPRAYKLAGHRGSRACKCGAIGSHWCPIYKEFR